MNKSGKWARRAVWATFAAVLTIGCNPLTTIAFIFHRDDKVAAAYPLPVKEDETSGKKKEEVKVAVFCGFGQTPPIEFATADRELVTAIVKRCPDILKEAGSKEKIVFVPTADVDKFKSANPNWRAMHPSAWGKKLGADYVMEITLAGLQIYQPRSSNQIYEGRAEVTVDVYDVAQAGAAPKHNYTHAYSYPKGMVRSVDAIPSASQFRQMYLDNLAAELILKHVEHKPSDGIASAR